MEPPPTGTSDFQRTRRNRSRSLGSRIIANASGNLALPIAAFATSPLLARSLGVDGRGTLAAATAPLLFLTVAMTLGLPDAANHFIAARVLRARDAVLSGLVLLAIVGGAMSALTVLAAPVLAGGVGGTADLVRLAILGLIPTLTIALLRGTASGLQRWRLVNLERWTNAIVRVAGLLALTIADQLNTGTATLVLVVAPVLSGLVYVGLLFGPRTLAPPAGRHEIRRLLGYGSRVWIGAISGILLTRLDQLLMTPLAGAAELGLYVVAVSVGELLLVGNGAIRDVIFSVQSSRRSDAQLLRAARVSLLVSVLAGAAVAVSCPLWMPLLFGEAFEDAVPVAEILILASVLGTPGSIAGAGLSARGRPGVRSISLVVAALVNLVALLLLVPSLGAVGAALATLLGNATSGNLNILFSRKLLGLRVLDFYVVRREDLSRIMQIVPLRRKGRGPAES